jgi:hypothetical protein
VSAETAGDAGEAARAGGEWEERPEPLLSGSDADGFRERWHELQTAFVDDPRDAVQGAHRLVGELMQGLAQTFAREREALEERWSSGGEPSTEDLRVALQRYRTFFERLLET